MADGFFITSIPKSGTHLLSSLVHLHTGQPCISVKKDVVDFSRFADHLNLVGHWRSSQVRKREDLHALVAHRNLLIMVRDPRDICNSMLPYVLQSQNPLHQAAAEKLRGLAYDEQIRLIAHGFSVEHASYGMPNVREACSGFSDLKRKLFPDARIFRYEDFFEEAKIVPLIAEAFSIGAKRALDLTTRALTGESKTKRAGGARPNQWRERFSPALKRMFAQEYADVLEAFGYPIEE